MQIGVNAKDVGQQDYYNILLYQLSGEQISIIGRQFLGRVLRSLTSLVSKNVVKLGPFCR